MLQIDNFNNYILKDINLKIDDNLIILGYNGAGKTTLAKTLCGIIESKNLKTKSKNFVDISQEDRTKLINYIPPKLEIFDENIRVLDYLNANILYTKNSVNRVCKELNCSYLLNRVYSKLSSGESQILLIAGAILHNAKYTILDEPTANLDPKRERLIFNILKGNLLNKKVVITHNLNLAYKLGFRIIFMKNGEIVFRGSNKEFFSIDNLNTIFSGSVKIIDEHIVTNL